MSNNVKDLNLILQDMVRSIEVISSRLGVDINLYITNESQKVASLSKDIYPDLTQIFTEIIANTPEGTIIEIYCKRLEDERPSIELKFYIYSDSEDIYIDESLMIKYQIAIINSKEFKIVELHFPIAKELRLLEKYKPKENHNIIKPLYTELRNRLTTHFKSVKNLEQHAVNVGEEQGKFITKINQVLAANISDSNFDISRLANHMMMSIPQLYRKMKAVTNMSPARYIRFVRLQKAKEYLEQGDLTISEVLLEVGIVSNSHFTKIFHKEFGFNPSAIKNSKMN